MTSPSNDGLVSHHPTLGTMEPLLVSAAIFLGLAATGFALPALPIRLHAVLGFDMTTVGWVMGLQSVAALLSRPWAGRITDRRGGKHAVMIGLTAMAGSGAIYGASTFAFLDRPGAFCLLITGRFLTGLGGGMIVTGGGAWMVGLAGIGRAGRAMSWIGLAMFGGLAAGAAIGAMLELRALAGLAIVAALLGLLIAARTTSAQSKAAGVSVPMRQVAAYVWRPGLALGLSSVGFAAVSSFGVLAYEANGWSGGGTAVAAFGVGHVTARLLLAGSVDDNNGPSVATATIMVEVIGLLMLWIAPVPFIALVGAAFAGFGFSMVYPLMALRMLRGVPEGSRGMAIGLYDAFYDIAMGVAGVVCGLIASHLGLSAVFLFSAGTALTATVAVSAGYVARQEHG